MTVIERYPATTTNIEAINVIKFNDKFNVIFDQIRRITNRPYKLLVSFIT